MRIDRLPPLRRGDYEIAGKRDKHRSRPVANAARAASIYSISRGSRRRKPARANFDFTVSDFHQFCDSGEDYLPIPSMVELESGRPAPGVE